MTVDHSGTPIVDAATRAIYDRYDAEIDQHVEALLKLILEPVTPKAYELPPGIDRMRYAAIERALMAAYSSLYRDFMRWKEGRS